MRRAITYGWWAALCILGLLAPCWFLLDAPLEHDIRSRPLHVHGGLISRAAPVGQTFFCSSPGLHRIDVALERTRPESTELAFTLRADGPHGAVLRRVVAIPDARHRSSLLQFSFDSLPDSAGRWFHFELAPAGEEPLASHSAWLRYHGQVGLRSAWGNESIKSEEQFGSFLSPLHNLRAVAVAFDDATTERGALRLRLWAEDDSGPAVRRSTLPLPTVVQGGFAIFSFPPIAESRGKKYLCSVTSDGPQRFILRDDWPVIRTFHGTPGSRPGLRGSTSGGNAQADRDIMFRAWSDRDRLHNLQVLRERLGPKGLFAALCWIAFVLSIALRHAARVRGTRKAQGAAE